MSTSQIVKINFLILGLGLTLYITHHIRTKGLSGDVLTLFGLQPTAPKERVARVASTNSLFDWNWCETRVSGLIKPDEFKLAQEGNAWVFESAAKQVVNFISVEKWLAQFCTVEAQRAKAKPAESYKPTLMVKFVDGHVELIRRSDEGEYFWRGQAFSSPEFDKALGLLKDLSQTQPTKRK